MAAAAFCLCAATAWTADAPAFGFQPNIPSPGRGVVRTTGVGLPPRMVATRGQLHLMAERAAIVAAYRNLALALGQGSQVVVDGTRYVTASGFIRGAQIAQTRYYPDGHVEVDVTLAVEHPPAAPAIEPPPPPVETPRKVETQKRQISEKEWLELYKQPRENKS
jgi:hypothetical protein